MKAKALITAAVVLCGTGAFAQQQDNTARTENSAAADSMKPADDAQRTKGALHRMGDKARHAMHRAEDKMRHTAKNEKDRHHERHASSHRHDDTRAMGAPGSSMRDAETSRRQRMDEAYANWKARQKNG